MLQDTPAGWEPWNALDNFSVKDQFRINDVDYIRINGQSKLNSLPTLRTSLFRFNGDFSSVLGSYQVYFSLQTRYGRYPRFKGGGQVRVG